MNTTHREDILMDTALDFTKPFKQVHLKQKTGIHPSIVGQWLTQQVRAGNLERFKINGTYWYDWIND